MKPKKDIEAIYGRGNRVALATLFLFLFPFSKSLAQAPIATRGVSGDRWADKILGQADHGIPNSAFGEIKFNEATSKNTFNSTSSVLDVARDILYLWDGGNSRVLVFQKVSQSGEGRGADAVLGQADFFHTACNHDSNWQSYDWHLPYNPPVPPNDSCFCGNAGQSPAESWSIANMAIDKTGNLYVPDVFNNRVLRFDYPVYTNEPASRVWGQNDFTSAVDYGGPLQAPTGTGLGFTQGTGSEESY